jgi:hypothetical protein
MSGNAGASVDIVYRFRFASGSTEIRVAQDPETLTILPPRADGLPDWTRLSFQKCGNCPLPESENARCPVAVNLVDVVDAFKDRLSHEPVEVEIESGGRRVVKSVPLAQGVRSLTGLVMAASGCPILDRLKPLVRTHQPFANWEETAFRVIGSYLIGQYFVAKHGGTPDWQLQRLGEFYDEVHVVNTSFCARLRAFCPKDAPINAVVELNSLADFASILIDREKFNGFQRTMEAHYAGVGVKRPASS